jgi:PHD/YefM family antitoxin component YafN of YafNO toxin-antitoxin module
VPDRNLKGVISMLNTNATSFRKDMFKLLEQTIKFNEPINISTKDGNAVVISEEDYNGLMETLYLSSMPEVKTAIIEGLKTSVSDCIPESEIQW